jgi:hypothetical protein
MIWLLVAEIWIHIRDLQPAFPADPRVYWLELAVVFTVWLAGVIGSGALLRIVQRRKRPLRLSVARMLLQELMVDPAVLCMMGPSPVNAVAPWRAGVFLGACALALWLDFRAPLPETLLPLRGRWLRIGLGVLALAGLCQFSVWTILGESLWRDVDWTGKPPTLWLVPLTADLVLALWPLWWTVLFLAGERSRGMGRGRTNCS